MKTGVVFPQTEIGADPVAVRDYVQAVEGLGFSHMMVYDHVLGADTSHHDNWQGSYTSESMFHEPFVLFGYLAGVTTTLELVTAVLILGQRQTALVAKQAAEVDLLTGGRLRLGVGVGWNHVEYEALGENFGNRGRRSEEQVKLLRELWTKDVVDFTGRYHRVTHAGINPRPIQQTIPIWFGGGADRVVRRIGEQGDGWFPQFQPDSEGQERIAMMRQFAKDAGRDPMAIGIEGRIPFGDGDPEIWNKAAAAWDEAGATHLSVNTMRSGLQGPDQHIEAIRKFKEAVSG